MSPIATVSVHRWVAFDALADVLAACLADLGGMERFVRPGQTVVIKPNITANAPEHTGGTTHVALAAAVARQAQRCGAGRVIIAEGTGAFGAKHETAFPTGGWRAMAAELGVELYNLDAGPHALYPLERPRYPHELPFSTLVHDCDVFITLPLLKTHITADYTVALKNSFCLTPQSKRTEIHRQYMIEHSLADMNRIRRPDLVVVDGWDGAEGIAGGTDFERPAGMRLLLASDDPVAVDVISRDLMQCAQRTRYLNWCIEDGVGVADRAHIRLLGEPVEACSRRFMLPAEELDLLLPGLEVRDGDACSGCRVPALAAIGRYRFQKLRKPLAVAFGPQPAPVRVQMPPEQAVTVGRCACMADAAGLGAHVCACPPATDDILAAIEATGAVCKECQTLTLAALAECAPEQVATLRASAAGAEVFAGPQVLRDAWHRELIVGDCMRRYVGIVRERATHFGLVAERDIAWVCGCPPTAEAIRQAIHVLVEA